MEAGGVRSAASNSNGSGVGMNHKWEKNHTVGLMGRAVRRNRLSDITNSMSSGRPGEPSMEGDQENSNVMPCPGTKDYVAQLMKENTALLKLVGERNKIIEMTGIEMQKLRFELQKVRQQNWQLAQANSQMQAELNIGKDRLKALQHELRCTKVVLKVKSVEVEEKEKLNKQMCKNIGCEEGHEKTAEVAVDASDQANGMKTSNASRKHTLKDPSQGPAATTHEEVAPQEKVERRRSLRRRSSNLKSESWEPMVELMKKEDVKVPVQSPVSEPLHKDTSVQLDNPAPSCFDVPRKPGKNEEQNGVSDFSEPCNQEVRRSLVGRPLRKAAEKVTSYKERPVKVKMRRVE